MRTFTKADHAALRPQPIVLLLKSVATVSATTRACTGRIFRLGA
jgi:hypothetical protein